MLLHFALSNTLTKYKELIMIFSYSSELFLSKSSSQQQNLSITQRKLMINLMNMSNKKTLRKIQLLQKWSDEKLESAWHGMAWHGMGGIRKNDDKNDKNLIKSQKLLNNQLFVQQQKSTKQRNIFIFQKKYLIKKAILPYRLMFDPINLSMKWFVQQQIICGKYFLKLSLTIISQNDVKKIINFSQNQSLNCSHFKYIISCIRRRKICSSNYLNALIMEIKPKSIIAEVSYTLRDNLKVNQKNSNRNTDNYLVLVEGKNYFMTSYDMNLFQQVTIYLKFSHMGNKILGKRSKSFYKGFNERQLDYIRQKFQLISKKGSLSKQLFMDAYKVNDVVCDRFFGQIDFNEDKSIDQYEFICAVHSLCSMTIEQLGEMFFRIITRGKQNLTEKNLLNFTHACLLYNAYYERKSISSGQISKENTNKFKKYDYDKSGIIQKEEFIKICLKDQTYKKWMVNMGFITERQLQFQDQIYDLVDSEIEQQICRHQTKCNNNKDKIKRGIQHRIQDDQFQIVQVVGDQSGPPNKPWKSSIANFKRDPKKKEIQEQNMSAPSQNLNIDHIYGYRSYDCRNNVKYDSKGRIIYHQGAACIVTQKLKNDKLQQNFLIKHQDDISCLDIADDLVVTGQVGSLPMVVLWQTNKKQQQLVENMIITKELVNSVGNVAISRTKKLLAVSCNDEDHKVVIYDLDKLRILQNDLTSKETGIRSLGPTTKNVIFDLKFNYTQDTLIAATLKEILFINFDKGAMNTSRGAYKNFSNSPTFCLASLKTKYNDEQKQFIISGMGNGSIYFWVKQQCVKAVCGHQGSVSALCLRKDCDSFISGDKTGMIIIWDQKFKKQYTIKMPKTNCPSKMIVALCCNNNKQLLIGTKSADIFEVKIGEDFSKARRIVGGHSQGKLQGLTIHRKDPYFYTGGEDQRIIKWEYKQKKAIDKQVKCLYKIKSLDFNLNRNLLLVGFSNGIVDCYGADNLDKKSHSYRNIKNPDQDVLNIVKFDNYGQLCAVSYLYPKTKILLLAVSEKDFKQLGEIQLNSKAISFDFEKQSRYIQLNTSAFQYFVYDISNKKQPKKVKDNFEAVRKCTWTTHSVAFSPQTQGIMTEGVSEEDITCCQRSRIAGNVVIIGDKYSKLKLFTYPTIKNQIFNKYFAHSNEVSAVQFNYKEDYVISLGGQQKSIIVWKYDPDIVNNSWIVSALQQQQQKQLVIDQSRMKKTKQLGQFEAVQQEGEQALSSLPFLGQIKNPSNYNQLYNPKRDNKLPDQSVKIKHVFGLRNHYLKDEVRNHCRFSKSYKQVLFPTACLGVKMNIQTRQQQFYHQHKEDIVSFAIDSKRQLMATGQMAEQNLYNPRKKILSIYVWNLEEKKTLAKLDGFHTIAIVLLEFSPSSKLLFSVGNDDKNTFAVYDWRSGSILYSGPVSRGKVNGIAWKSDQQFLTCGNDHVKFWTNNKGSQGKIDGKTQGMYCCVYAKNIFITGSGDGGIYNWVGNISQKKIKAHSNKVQSLVAHGEYVYSGGDDGKILSWKMKKNGQIEQPETFYDVRNAFSAMIKTIPIIEEEFGVLSIDFSPKGQHIIGTKGASIIHVSNNKAKIVQQGHYKGQLWGLATQLGSQYIVTGGDDCSVRLWDIKQRKQVNRAYFDNKIRGIAWSNDRQGKIAIADARSKLYLYDKTLNQKYCQYTGKPYQINESSKIEPFVEDIKFSPDSKYLVYGCHGQSMYLEYVKVNGKKLIAQKSFKGSSSALLHVDWSRDSSMISINTQDYSLLFFDLNGKMISATSTKDEEWATWSRKFGFPVQGIFQGVDFTDVNRVCRDPSGKFLAVGYDDQSIRLFKYPCYIPKQVCKQFFGHSSHVTNINFTSQYMVSLGGLDRTIIIWDIQGRKTQKMMAKRYGQEDQSDGLQNLDDDVDVPGKAIAKKPKIQKPSEFYQDIAEGDQFMAIKPWLGAIKQPTYQYPADTIQAPSVQIELEYVHGYRCKDSRQNLYFSDRETLIYHAAAVVIYHNIQRNTQKLLVEHADDILSIDYHKDSGQVITGQLGPKPLVCLFKDGVLKNKFKSPVSKGVLAIAISPNGDRAACAGMDQDHNVAVLDLETSKVLSKVKGGKKVILKMGWVNNSQFVTIGIAHYKFWSFDGKLTAKQGRNRQNLVSLAIKDGLILTGASKGKILSWKGNSKVNQISLLIPGVAKKNEKQYASVVECISIQSDFVAAGTKDGLLYILDKTNLQVKNMIQMKSVFQNSGIPSQNPAIRSIDFLNDKICVGTLGAQIYIVQSKNPTKDTKCKSTNYMKGHFSPNNSWTNEVWGLCLDGDFVFTCSDDATLRCWSIQQRKLLSCASLNLSQNKTPLQKDKKTNDFSQAAKGRAVCLSPDKKEIIVGCKNGTVRIYTFNRNTYQMTFRIMFRHAKQWISDIKTAFNTVIIGSHDNAIYVYDYEDGTIKKKYKPLNKHSSYITHIDVSRDSCYLQSTCGAYQLLFWDLNTGKQLTSGATMLRDERWQSWTCNLGWPVQGIYPKATDGTFINAVDRSNFSINQTIYKDDSKSHYLLAAGNDLGKVCLYNFPCTKKGSKYIQGHGHSSHVTNVRWSNDDKYIISTGGQDQCVMYWRIKKNR